jgi:hypothetical protein
MRPPPNLKRFALAWLRKEDWPRWLEIDSDFQPDYYHWLRRVTDAEARLKSDGVNVVRIDVLPEEFIEWAQSNGCPLDTRGRSAYATWKVSRMDLH